MPLMQMRLLLAVIGQPLKITIKMAMNVAAARSGTVMERMSQLWSLVAIKLTFLQWKGLGIQMMRQAPWQDLEF